MFRVSMLAIVGSVFFPLQGCQRHEASQTATLTVADARRALIEMVTKGDSDVKYFLEPLKTADPVVTDGGKIVEFGPWRCNLVERKFVFGAAASDWLLQVNGVFRPRDGGGWLAEIESITQT